MGLRQKIHNGPILLSICMPTYKRPECVRASLRNYCKIITQARLQDAVELCISDNNSDDVTQRIVSKYMNSGLLRIRYNKNKSNLGADRNTLIVLSMARGKYLHLVSDKDRYSQVALEEIVSALYTQLAKVICIVSYNIPTMPALTRLPRLSTPHEFFSQAFSYRGNQAAYFVGLCWYVVPREDFENFKSLLKKIPEAHDLWMIHTPLFIYSISKADKVLVRKEDFRDAEDPVFRPSILTVNFPSDMARVFYHNYFISVRASYRIGGLKREDFEFFKSRFYLFLITNLFKLRARIPPQMFIAQRSEIIKNLQFMDEDYSGIAIVFFRLYESIILSPSLPFHLIYRGFLFVMRHVFSRQRQDYHSFYLEAARNRAGIQSLEEYNTK